MLIALMAVEMAIEQCIGQLPTVKIVLKFSTMCRIMYMCQIYWFCIFILQLHTTGSASIVNLLFDWGATVNEPNIEGGLPIHDAVRRGTK